MAITPDVISRPRARAAAGSCATLAILWKLINVEDTELLTGCHYNGDRFWDGDQTLWELTVREGERCASVLAVVPRGEAFIPAPTVAAFVEALGESLDGLMSRARRPAPDRRAQVVLPIEPGWAPG